MIEESGDPTYQYFATFSEICYNTDHHRGNVLTRKDIFPDTKKFCGEMVESRGIARIG
jgi:hypothetical protein